MVMELTSVRGELHHMWTMIRLQLRKCEGAVLHCDEQLAHSVLKKKKDVIEYHLLISKGCHFLLEETRPIGAELRQVITILKISENLTRISGITESMAKLVLNEESEYAMNAIDRLRISENFIQLGLMLSETDEAFRFDQPVKARKVFQRYSLIEQTSASIKKGLLSAAKSSFPEMNKALSISLINHRLERAAEQCSNLAEQIIIYQDERLLTRIPASNH
jgi:phosphate transport system protein